MSPFSSRSPALPKTTSLSMLTVPAVEIIADSSGARRLAPPGGLGRPGVGDVAVEEEVAELARRLAEAGNDVEDVGHAGVEVELGWHARRFKRRGQAPRRLRKAVRRAAELDRRREAGAGVGQRVGALVVRVGRVIRKNR